MNKGFTLLETLAVIVILTIIALIVTPIVINVVNSAQEAADKRSLEQFVKVVKKDYLEKKINNSKLSFNNYMVNYASEIIYDGNKVTCEYYNIIDNDIELFNCIIGERKYYNYKAGNITKASKKIEQENDVGKVVYFDVSLGERCSSEQYKEANSNVGYNGINPNENQTSCLKFYAFEIEDEKLSLIMDHDIIESATYCFVSSYPTEFGPVPSKAWERKKADEKIFSDVVYDLNLATKSWNGVLQNDFYSNENFNYNGVKARLLTQKDIDIINNLFENVYEVLGNNTYPKDSLYSDYPDVYVSDVRPTYSFTYNFKLGIRPVVSIEI